MKSSVPLLLISMGVFGYAAMADQATAHRPAKIVFGRDVVPILTRCYKCHGPDAAKAAGGLRLDSLVGAAKAIVPGNPGKSLILDRVSAKNPDDLMPPPDSGVKALTPEQIETLRTWIAEGAKYEEHWAFVPPKMSSVPSVRDTAWPKNLIDRFVLSKLEEAGLKPEPEADRDTLALRAAETLTGLPPTPAELTEFRRDAKPGAYERYVDRLLARPAYGEHQARYWLDAVRYADTHGLQLDNERGIYPYRDWVIRSFNEDLPFNRFVEWQLAGDLLPKPTTDQLMATGYVRCNMTSNEGGAIEEEFLARNTFDRVDTTSTVMLGLTVQCAKCHDHKFDPIKQKDYYGLYAFFDSTTDSPLDGNIAYPPPVIKAATPAQEERLAAMDRSLAECRRTVAPAQAAQYFSRENPALPTDRDWQHSPAYVRDSFGEAFDAVEPPEPGQPGSVNWQPLKFEVGKNLLNFIGKENASEYVRGTINYATARTVNFGISSDDAVKVWLNGKLIHAHKVNRGVDEASDRVTANFRAGDNEILIKVVNGAGPDGLNLRLYDPSTKRIVDALAAYSKSPDTKPVIDELCTTYLELGPSNRVSTEFRRLSKERSVLSDAIPMTLIAQEMPTARPTFILKRGQYNQKGDAVTRHIPAVLGSLPAGSTPDRLSLAQWLIAPSNPLLARVFVNRIWQQHFGVGLIKTSEDFGTQGEWPLDQPLLDYLAVSFMKNGWSLKKLNRLIVTSAAFRQSSRISARKLAVDPENRLIDRGPRFRLDAEVIRDKALYAGGLLWQTLGGRGFKPYQPDGIWEAASDPASQTHIFVRDKDRSIYRRSMYMFWKRTAPPPDMVGLDAPLRDTCVVRRSITDTPLQALTVENETGFVEAARTMAARLLSLPASDDKRMAMAFDLALARKPRSAELTVLDKALTQYRRKFAADPEAARRMLKIGDTPQAPKLRPAEQAAWMIVCSTLMNTDEFLTLH